MKFGSDEAYVELNGDWLMAYSMESIAPSVSSADDIERAGLEILPAVVPGNFELDLQRNGIIEDPFFGMNAADLRRYEHAHIWYFRRFSACNKPGHIAELVFEGLDCYADIHLNGQLIGSTDNMLVEHIIGVTNLLRDENELLVHIKPAVQEARKYPYTPGIHAMAANYESLYVRKAPHMYGWDIMPRIVSAGIWRPVSLRYRPVERLETAYLEDLLIWQDRSRARLALNYKVKMSGEISDRYVIGIDGRRGLSTFSESHAISFDAGRFVFIVDNPQLWWPRGRGDADMYDVTVTLLKNDIEIDRCSFTHGIRNIRLERTSVTDADGNGEFCFHINGEKIFMMGTNWVPADAFHSRDASRLPDMLELADDIGCNIIRCWGGNVYEDDIFYDFCDRKGIVVWQDFAMACAVYPQDDEFCSRLTDEVRKVVRRLRHHPCIVLWSGDNECDCAYSWGGHDADPNTNILTREVIPHVLREEDPTRPYLPSSPYMDEVAYQSDRDLISENHLWGPRDYYKGDFYKNSLCHFASEIGYHGCPSPESIRKFISPDKVWPYQDNDEWLLHCTSPVPELKMFDYRVELMAKQIRVLFGEVPDNFEDYAFASQASQAEAKKFFIELFRSAKWRRTGIIWWNLIDGWPQFSDAIVDYYFEKKIAYDFIKRAQSPIYLILREPKDSSQNLVACNDTRQNIELDYAVRDMDTMEILAEGRTVAESDSVTSLAQIPYTDDSGKFYSIGWHSSLGTGKSHYLAGKPPFDLATYRGWLKSAGFIE